MQNQQTNEQKNNPAEAVQPPQAKKRPDDRGAIQIDAHIEIFDPNTKETFLEGRA